MKHTVLVADSDQAFATILREALEATGEYAVTAVPTAGAALDAVRDRPFDMVILDSALADVPLIVVIETVRATWPAIRVMLIPRANNRIPAELRAVEVQGLLPKPFFVEDLPSIVRHAMELDDAIPLSRLAELADDAPVTLSDIEAEVFLRMAEPSPVVSLPQLTPLSESELAADDASVEARPTAVAPVDAPCSTEAAVAQITEPVAKPERSADAAAVAPGESLPSMGVVTPSAPPRESKNSVTLASPASRVTIPGAEDSDRSSGDGSRYAGLAPIIRALERELSLRAVVVTSGNRVIASGGAVNPAQQTDLARLIADRMESSSRLMGLLGDLAAPVDLVLEESRDVRVYTVRVTGDVLLTVATDPDLPLGSLRYRTRQAAEQIVAALSRVG